jgi:peroxiredoxin family protein
MRVMIFIELRLELGLELAACSTATYLFGPDRLGDDESDESDTDSMIVHFFKLY